MTAEYALRCKQHQDWAQQFRADDRRSTWRSELSLLTTMNMKGVHKRVYSLVTIPLILAEISQFQEEKQDAQGLLLHRSILSTWCARYWMWLNLQMPQIKCNGIAKTGQTGSQNITIWLKERICSLSQLLSMPCDLNFLESASCTPRKYGVFPEV